MKYRGLLLPMILAAMCGDDAFVLNTKRGKGMQSTYRREKIVRTEKEFDINGTKVMAYSRKDAIKRLKHKKQKTYFYVNVSFFSFLLKGAPAREGVRSLYLYNA